MASHKTTKCNYYLVASYVFKFKFQIPFNSEKACTIHYTVKKQGWTLVRCVKDLKNNENALIPSQKVQKCK